MREKTKAGGCLLRLRINSEALAALRQGGGISRWVFNGAAYFVLYGYYGIYPVLRPRRLFAFAAIICISANPLNPDLFNCCYAPFAARRGLCPRGGQLAERQYSYFPNGARPSG